MLRSVFVLTLLFAVLLPGAATGQTDASTTEQVLYLHDGTVLPGRIVDETEDSVVLEHATLGRLVVAREFIERIESTVVVDPRAHWKTDPSYNSILLTPTPATLPKGTGYFRSFELFFLNFGAAPTDNLDLALGTVFPISSDFFGLMAGGKLRIVDREKYPVGLAVAGSWTYFDDLQNDALWTLSGIAGIGDTRKSFNVSVGGAFSGSNGETVISVGGDFQVGARTKLLAEFGTVGGLLFDEDEFDGIMNVGFRFFGDPSP
jgi:hypothetical protein